MIIDELISAAVVILFSWSAVLLWASWRLRQVMKELDTERQELRRWQRLAALAKHQNSQWQ